MAGDNEVDKPGAEPPSDVPRMVGDSDLDLIQQVCQLLPLDARIIEFGPWLGGVTQVLAPYGEVHVVDRFVWSDLNEQAFPGSLKSGDSFYHLFETAMAVRDINPTVHKTEFQDFEWHGGDVDFAFIDAPRNAKQIMQCLVPIADSLKVGSHIIIKNAMNPKYPEMMALVEILTGKNIFEIVQCGQPNWNTSAYLRADSAIATLSEVRPDQTLFEETAPIESGHDPWDGRLLGAARLAERIAASDLTGALRHLSMLPQDRDILYAWDKFELQFSEQEETRVALAAFAEILAQQVDPFPNDMLKMDLSLSCCLRAWWSNCGDEPWRITALVPELLEQARLDGAMYWPHQLQTTLRGNKIIEIGNDLNYAGVGYSAAGATEYLGLETRSLNALMMQLESALPAVTYLPLASFRDEMAEGVSHVFIHEPAPRNARAVEEAVARLRKFLPKGATPMLLPVTGKPRRYVSPSMGQA